MTPDTAAMTVATPTARQPAAARRSAPAPRPRARRPAPPLDDPARIAAVRDTWRALWVSRLLVWVAGVGAVAVFGVVTKRAAFDPPHVTSGFGWLGDLLAAPAARWDAAWYLVIAHYGYRPGSVPSPRALGLLPALSRSVSGAISELGVPPVLAGVLLSLAALALALYGIHRLTTLEAGRRCGTRRDWTPPGGRAAGRAR